MSKTVNKRGDTFAFNFVPMPRKGNQEIMLLKCPSNDTLGVLHINGADVLLRYELHVHHKVHEFGTLVKLFEFASKLPVT